MGGSLMGLFRNIRGFITNNPVVFAAFALLMILSICSALFTFNFLLSVIQYNENRVQDERTYMVEVGVRILITS